MKKVLFFAAFLLSLSASANAQIIKSNVPDGADPAALPIEFLFADALVLPNGDIQMGVALKATGKNIGTLPYFPGMQPLHLKLYIKKGQNWVQVESKAINVLQPGMKLTFNYYTSYIKNKQKPPTFRLVVDSKNVGVINPDVNMLNNRKEAQAQ